MYIVLEVQTNTDQTVGTLVTSFADKDQAESKYHLVLASAAVSSLPRHSAFLLTDDGSVVRRECYQHAQQEAINEG